MKDDSLRRIRNTDARHQGLRNIVAPQLSRQFADLPPLVRVTSINTAAGTVGVRYVSSTGAFTSQEYTVVFLSDHGVQVGSDGILVRDVDGNLVFLSSAGGDSIVPCVITSQDAALGTYGVSALFGSLSLPSAQLLEFPGGHAMQAGDRVGVFPIGFGWILPTRPRLVKIVSGTNPYTVIESDVFGTTRGINFEEVWDIAGGAAGYTPLSAGTLAVMYIDYNNNRFLWGGAPAPATPGAQYRLRFALWGRTVPPTAALAIDGHMLGLTVGGNAIPNGDFAATPGNGCEISYPAVSNVRISGVPTAVHPTEGQAYAETDISTEISDAGLPVTITATLTLDGDLDGDRERGVYFNVYKGTQLARVHLYYFRTGTPPVLSHWMYTPGSATPINKGVGGGAMTIQISMVVSATGTQTTVDGTDYGFVAWGAY